MKKIFFGLLLVSVVVRASTLECESLVNLDTISSDIVSTQLSSKTQISSTDEVVSYVTETKPGVFLVEAFLPSLEIRIYAEGELSAGSELKASTWARSIMVDVVCKKLK